MTWLSWPFRLIGFLFWFAWQLVTSNVAVLKDNLTPGQSTTNGIARFRSACRTDFELTLLASLITLTPGTLTMGTEKLEMPQGQDDERHLFVHGMYHPDADALRKDLRDMETHMLRAVRRRGYRPATDARAATGGSGS